MPNCVAGNGRPDLLAGFILSQNGIMSSDILAKMNKCKKLLKINVNQFNKIKNENIIRYKIQDLKTSQEDSETESAAPHEGSILFSSFLGGGRGDTRKHRTSEEVRWDALKR